MSSVEVQELLRRKADLQTELVNAIAARADALSEAAHAAHAVTAATDRMFRLKLELSRVEDELVEAEKVAAG